MRKRFSCVLMSSLFLIACFVLGLFAPIKVSADNESVIDEINITVSVSCTMGGVGMDSHTATLQNDQYSSDSSTYANGIGKTTLTTFCNDYNGFSIYAVGYTGDSQTGANHTKLVGTNTNETISTAVHGSSDTASSWAMKVTKVTDGTVAYVPANMSIQNSFDAWHVVPDTYAKVAQYKANTGSSATDTVLGGKVETTYAAYVSATQPADTYVGKVKYTLVHPYDEEPLQPQSANPRCINYFANASNAVGTMGCQSASDGNSIDLLASNFSRTGYGFAGWSDSFDYATNPSAHFYGPQETITVPTGTTANGLSLYAVWIKSQGSIQDQSKVASVCNSLTVASTNGTANLTSVSALTDQRDNETYAIARLADGNCWMIENMRLENTGTDNTNGSLAQGYNASFAGLAGPEGPSLFANVTTANTLYSTDDSTDKTISGSNRGYRFPRYNNVNTPTTATDRPSNPISNGATNSASNAGMYSYGNYYTWAAAIADTTYYTSGDHDTTSICPTGWKLPLGNTSTGDIGQGAADTTNRIGSFSWLDRKMGGTGAYQSTTEASLRWRKYPNNFVYSGYVDSGSVGGYGSYGRYWSSTVGSGGAYGMNFGSSYVGPGTGNGYNYSGRSIRCLVSSV